MFPVRDVAVANDDSQQDAESGLGSAPRSQSWHRQEGRCEHRLRTSIPGCLIPMGAAFRLAPDALPH